MSYDQAQNSRLGQRTGVEQPGVRMVQLAELPEIAYRGQLIYNITSDLLYVYNGSAWQPIGDNSGIQVFVQTSTPSGAQAGDQWYNPSTQVLQIYTGSAWVGISVAPGSITQAAIADNSVTAAKIADNAVGASELAAAAITSKHTLIAATYYSHGTYPRALISPDATYGPIRFEYGLGEAHPGYITPQQDTSRPLLVVSSGTSHTTGSTAAQLYLYGAFSGGGGKSALLNTSITVEGTVTETSAAKYKTDISDLPYDKDELLALRPVQYRDTEGEAQVGFIADEAFNVGADAWVIFKDGQVEGFAYTRWTAALQQICREQQEEIDALKSQLSSVLERLDALESME